MEIRGSRVELAMLNHPDSRLATGRDMTIRGDSIVGDAHYYAGGNLRFEKLDGSAGAVSSPHDPVILAIGDVTLGDYTGRFAAHPGWGQRHPRQCDHRCRRDSREYDQSRQSPQR